MLHTIQQLRRTLRRLTARGASERGDANVEMILIFPVVAAIFFGFVQGAIWLDASNAAQAAAQVAYNSARTYDGTSTDGSQAAETFISKNAHNLQGANVQVNRNATTVTVTVTGHSLTIIPGLFGTNITKTFTGPVERWVP